MKKIYHYWSKDNEHSYFSEDGECITHMNYETDLDLASVSIDKILKYLGVDIKKLKKLDKKQKNSLDNYFDCE